MPNKVKIDIAFSEMGTLLVDTIFVISENAKRKNDKDLKGEINNAVYILTKIFVILNKVANHTQPKLVSDKDFESQMILWQSCNALIGSLQLIRQGFTLEPQIIIRNAIENLALALSFYGENQDDFFQKHQKSKLSGEKCIKEATKLIKQIGPIYGLLSTVAHPSKKTLGYYYMEERGTLLIGGGVTANTKHRVKFNLAILNFILCIHWSSVELIFNKYIDKFTFWKVEGNVMKWQPDSSEQEFYTNSLKMFEEAIAELNLSNDKNIK